MPNLKTIQTGKTKIASVTINAVGVDPIGFLRHNDSEQCGLWTKGDSWIAHSGAVGILSSDGIHVNQDRFGEIRDQAERLLELTDVSSQPMRLYGGFSFGDHHKARGAWEGFPAALFHVPELELEGSRRQSARLTARVVFNPERIDLEQVRVQLLHTAESVCKDSREHCKENLAGKETVGLQKKEDFDRTIWQSMIDKALRYIDDGILSKVVLARTQDLVTKHYVNPVDVVDKLWKANRGSHIFLFKPDRDSYFLGAAPETVTRVSKGQFQATAVAGTASRGQDVKEQQMLAEGLLASAKDAVEHCITRDDILTRLGTLVEDVDAQGSPHVLILDEMQHLETEIKAKLRQGTEALQVLEALHPTPAVCGFPRETALHFLSEEEPFERGWYAGPVGWFDTDGDAAFVPALRCAVVHGNSWRLFAGAGIVAGSDASAEWEETNVKFSSVTKALAENRVEMNA
ncbi:MAG: isochorismate synthase [bacterium]|jgi:menaquinone-specific isochorismate synthase